MAQNFSYVIPNKLCAMECPGTHADIEEDLAFLQKQGVSAIVTLTERPLPERSLARHSILVRHLPIRDFTAPTIDRILEFVRCVDEWLREGKSVMVHCGAGYGRTGTMLAAYFVWKGLSAAEAIRRVRQSRPMSIETREQEMRIREFEKYVYEQGIRNIPKTNSQDGNTASDKK